MAGGRKGKERKGVVMSLVFEEYERQFCEVSANLYSKCPAADEELKKQSISEINAELQEAESLIKKMDLEARTLEHDVRTRLLAKIRDNASDLKNLKNLVKKLASAHAHRTTREELLELGMGDKLEVSADQRGRLLMESSSTDRLNSSTDRIRESKQLMVESEELGASILQDLHQQRQSLLHAHSTLQGVDDSISRSKKILTAMARRMDRNKWMGGFIIAVLVLTIIIILYFKLSH